jgi:hypothetical protein
MEIKKNGKTASREARTIGQKLGRVIDVRSMEGVLGRVKTKML